MERKYDCSNRNNHIISIAFSLPFLIGIIVCLICDIAISGKFTWSLITVSSIVFAWLVSLPVIIFNEKKVIASLISLSIFVIPFLFFLSRLIKVKEVFSIGLVTAIISIVFLWIIVVIFSRIEKSKLLVSLGVVSLLSIPFTVIVNVILSKMFNETIFDIWDIVSVFVLLAISAICFFGEYVKKRRIK